MYYQTFKLFSAVKILGVGALSLALVSCGTQDEDTKEQPTRSGNSATVADGPLVAFDTLTLENGLKVILHRDTSDPVVAVALTAHVGSAREKEGRTGFAHLFEHLLFLESENLGKGGLDQMSARIGGSGANGSTSRDRTNYFQTVPKDALEKMIWAEADKLGYFINTVTDPVLAKEKQVVKNEKRQSVDNRPYGHTQYIIDKALYPDGHPYSWQVIGSLEDLQAATLGDVKEFFHRWYVPNNVTLVIAGDFEPEQVKEWVHKYFDEIPRSDEIIRQPKQPAALVGSKSLYFEDNFARQPELRLTWPTVPQYAPDSYALNVLADLLTVGKDAPFNKLLIDEEKLTSTIFMSPYNSELAGQMILGVRAFAGIDLDTVHIKIDEAFTRFETSGIDAADLDRVKTQQEVAFFDSIGSVLGKAFSLAQYEIFAGDAGFIEQDIKLIRAVTAEDVMRVYAHYIKGRPYIATSIVPKGMAELTVEGAVVAEVVEEKIIAGAEDTIDPSVAAEYERTASSFDRTVEPTYGEKPVVSTPQIWQASGDNGLSIYGIEDRELPLVQFNLTIEGGQLLEKIETVGTVNLLTEILDKGTQSRTAAELEEEIASLGAVVSVSAGSESIQIEGSTLARNFNATIALLSEMILTPRFDETEFELAKLRAVNELEQQAASPLSIADRVFTEVVYGEDHILSKNILGSKETLGAITVDTVKSFAREKLSPRVSHFHVAGAVAKDEVLKALGDLTSKWQRENVVIPDYSLSVTPERSKIYFYDVPGAKQSQFRFGYPALTGYHPQFYSATAMNYRLGGGSFASQLTQELREGKGYTYGIGSRFVGGKHTGLFVVTSGVRSNVTAEALSLVHSIMKNYGAGFSENDLEITRNFFEKSRARAFETLSDKINILTNISHLGLPIDYISRQDAAVQALSIGDVRELARTYVRPDATHYVIVGDKATQFDRLKELGLGELVLLNPEGDK